MESKTDIHVRLTKTDRLPEGSMHPLGGRNLGPIDTGYYVLGHCEGRPVVGEPFVVARYESNGVKVFGIFFTSPVERIVENNERCIVFETQNSRYRLDFLA